MSAWAPVAPSLRHLGGLACDGARLAFAFICVGLDLHPSVVGLGILSVACAWTRGDSRSRQEGPAAPPTSRNSSRRLLEFIHPDEKESDLGTSQLLCDRNDGRAIASGRHIRLPRSTTADRKGS